MPRVALRPDLRKRRNARKFASMASHATVKVVVVITVVVAANITTVSMMLNSTIIIGVDAVLSPEKEEEYERSSKEGEE